MAQPSRCCTGHRSSRQFAVDCCALNPPSTPVTAPTPSGPLPSTVDTVTNCHPHASRQVHALGSVARGNSRVLTCIPRIFVWLGASPSDNSLQTIVHLARQVAAPREYLEGPSASCQSASVRPGLCLPSFAAPSSSLTAAMAAQARLWCCFIRFCRVPAAVSQAQGDT